MMNTLNELKTKLQQKLYIIEQQPGEVLFKWKQSAEICAAIVIQLKNEIRGYKFENEGQEIHFYKETVPWFYSQAIYYHRLFHIEAKLSANSHIGRDNFIKNKLLKIHRFLKSHYHLSLYMKLGETNRDEQYFLRKNRDTLYTNALFLMDDHCTEQVYKLAKIMALEKVKRHLEARLPEMEQQPIQQVMLRKAKPSLRWTGTKSDLIELVYALHSSPLFNDGKTIDVRQIANWLETTLHVDLGNYYRVFQGIRSRKKNRTQFLDNLRENLIQRMDEADEYPRN